MPDGSSRPAPTRTPVKMGGGIRRDQIDLRDRLYEPTLAQLKRRLAPDPLLVATLRDPGNVLMPRQQGNEGTCGGQALAALIDIHHIVADGAGEECDHASARMLYEMARKRQEPGVSRGDGVTLRDVIKGFYNYGACKEAKWPYVPEASEEELTFQRARDAKNTSLGAYYRLRPNLNTYHAALHETGAVLVSAELHDGWQPQAVSDAGGEIHSPRTFGAPDALAGVKHAFVIVGYTPEGFIILNSWGPEWGNWRADQDAGPEGDGPGGAPGLALWHYDDWADRVVDGWVLRLGVGAAEAFEFSVGDQGMGFGGDARVRSTPVHAILGHYMHLDDGRYVERGSYPSTKNTLDETFKFLREPRAEGREPWKGILLNFGGAILDLSDAAAQIARYKRVAKEAGWFPMTALWCVDYVDQTREILAGVFRDAGERAGRPGEALDRLIEARAHGVGRAFWRDIEVSADKSSKTGMPFRQLVTACLELAGENPGLGLRIITESEGAIALARLIPALRAGAFGLASAQSEDAPDSESNRFFEMLQSVDIVAPAMTVGEFSQLASDIDRGWGLNRLDRPIRLHMASPSDERRLGVPPYGESYVDLVARSFHTREVAASPRMPDRPLNKARAKTLDARRVAYVPVTWVDGRRPSKKSAIRQKDLLYGSDVAGRIRTALDITPPET